MNNKLWIDDPINILFGKKNFLLILPDRKDPLFNQVNSFTRFLIVYGSALSVYHKSWTPVAWSLLLALVVTVVVSHMVKRRTTTRVSVYHADATEPEVSAACATVTSNNPFANPVIGDNTSRPCQQTDTRMSDKLFVKDLPLNEWDIYGKENSQRQFYSIVDNDQTAFAKRLYSTDTTCREFPTRCMGSYGN